MRAQCVRDTVLRSSWFIRVMHESSMCEGYNIEK